MLHVFPPHGLDNSLLTAVLLGLYVRLFFTETFGWVFSGLVVPGYLASVLVVRPASALVIAVEALLTYAIVHGLSRALSATRLGTPMFGRDRFIWIVLTSIAVRVLLEGFVGPSLQAALRARGVDVGGAFGFYGVGLVLVPLAANACWKPGLGRGAFQLAVTTGMTLLLLRAALVLTNLSLASMALSFEHIAVDFAASPKAYLLIIAGALVASRANLRWGWDSSGVLIPGLLCLGWFNPLRLVATVLEAVLVAAATFGALKLPRLREWNVEGPRRVVLVFTIGYLSKLVFLWLVHVPGYGAHELFGIGYLLPSLLAVKIWQKRNPALVLLPTLQLSVAGVLLGSAAGFALVRVAPAETPSAIAAATLDCGEDTTVAAALHLARARVARHPPSPRAPRVSSAELQQLSNLVAALERERARAPLACATLPKELRQQLGLLGLRASDARIDARRRFLAVTEATDEPEALRGFGLLLMASTATKGPSLLLARPQRDLADPAELAPLVEHLDADAVVVGALSRTAQGRGDPEHDADVPLRAMVAAADGRWLIVRSSDAARSSAGRRIDAATVQSLTALLPDLERASLTRWNGELLLAPADERRLGEATAPPLRRFAGPGEWLAAARASSAGAGATSNLAALLLAEEVLRPLMESEAIGELPSAVRGAAASLGVQLARIDQPPALVAWGPGTVASSGALIVGAATDSAPVIELQRAAPGGLELAATLGASLRAGTLILDGHAHAPLVKVARAVALLHRREAPAIVLRPADEATEPLIVDDVSVGSSGASAQLSSEVATALAALGLPARTASRYHGDDGGAPGDLALLRARAAPFVDVVLGPAALARFRAAPLSPGDRQLLARAGIGPSAGSLPELLAHGCPASTAAPAALIAALRLFVETHHPGALERAVALARSGGWSLSLTSGGRFAEPWIVAGRAHGATAIALTPHVVGSATVPCGTQLRDAIARAVDARRGVVAVEVQR